MHALDHQDVVLRLLDLTSPIVMDGRSRHICSLALCSRFWHADSDDRGTYALEATDITMRLEYLLRLV